MFQTTNQTIYQWNKMEILPSWDKLSSWPSCHVDITWSRCNMMWFWVLMSIAMYRLDFWTQLASDCLRHRQHMAVQSARRYESPLASFNSIAFNVSCLLCLRFIVAQSPERYHPTKLLHVKMKQVCPMACWMIKAFLVQSHVQKTRSQSKLYIDQIKCQCVLFEVQCYIMLHPFVDNYLCI